MNDGGKASDKTLLDEIALMLLNKESLVDLDSREDQMRQYTRQAYQLAAVIIDERGTGFSRTE